MPTVAIPLSLTTIFLLIVGGCVSQKANGVQPDTLSSVGSYCSPVIYKKISGSAQERPSWVMKEPSDSGGFHYLVGMSGYHSTERDARDSAMRHAREVFAKYTGIEVTEIDNISKEIYGTSSSAILDPTISEKTQSSQETNAMVSRTKAKEWYFEVLNASCGGKITGAAYQYFVLAEVPLEEYDRVQAWKAKKEAALTAEKASERDRIKQELGDMVSSHNKALAEVDTLIERAEPQYAMKVLQGNWNALYDMSRALGGRSGVLASDISQLQLLQRETAAEMQRVLSPIVIDPGRHATAWVSKDTNVPSEVQAWVWYKQEEKIRPLSGIPVLLKESRGNKIIARGISDSNGQVLFEVKGITPGNYDIYVDMKIITQEPEQKFISAGGSSIAVKSYKPDMQGAAKIGAYKLFKGPSQTPLPATKVVLGSVRYSNSRTGSQFGRKMELLIERELSQISGITLIRRPEKRDVKVLERVDGTRGITSNVVLPMSSPAIQATLDDAEASLEVNYSIDEGKQVNIDMRLIQALTGKVISSAGAPVDRSLIPNGMEILPPSSAQNLESLTTETEGEIKLELTTQRGDGATFAEGEKIQYLVSSNKGAYLLLLYRDASGSLIQIYPNVRSGKGIHAAGEYFAIPDETMPFDFEITPPFGVEQVFGFAAISPFPELKGSILPNGLKKLEEKIEEVVIQLRDHSKKSGGDYGETNVVVTTVKE